ncbi:hypothetical protein [Niveispirillum sp. KHB5.9]|uniref:hypothetical protein n=1 Tax=Niveispirillum sp. KHB5.9 TaxID=3400269 RepID=UPI003A8530AD
MSGLLVREVAVSIAINSALNLGFTWLAFHGVELVAVDALVIDLIPTAFMIALMGSVVPSLINRRRLTPVLSVRFILLRGAGLALLSAALVVPAASLLLRGVEGLDWAQVLYLKMPLGAVIALAVTSWSLRGLGREIHA